MDERRLVQAYLARDEHVDGADAPVLIKHYSFDLCFDRSAAATRLFEELSELEQLRDPGVVALLGHDVIDDRLVTVQAHPPGVTLFELCELARRRTRLPVAVCVYIVRSLLATLQRCHTRPGRPLIHGRVNLGCITLPRVGQPQLSDFSLARLTDEAAEAESNIGFFQTRISYMAPELAPGQEPTVAADTYGLGLVLYRLLSDANPFRGRSAAETLQRVLRQVPGPLDIPGWPGCERANAILARALAKTPAERYSNCEALWQDLGAVQDGSDEVLAEQLSAIVQSSGADWGRAEVLANSSRESKRRQMLVRSARPVPLPHFDSSTPAFASGLLSDQPKNVLEHTERERQARGERRSWSSLAVATLAIAAAALAVPAVVELGRDRANRSASAAAASVGAIELGQPSDRELEASLRRCTVDARLATGQVALELQFDAAGALAGVRIEPRETVRTRLGACLLEAAWRVNPKMPGANVLVLDPAR